MAKITRELQETLIAKPNIKVVHFDKNGRHYFYAHTLIASKEDKKKPRLYGQGTFSHRQIIPGAWNTDKQTEVICKGVQETAIVESLDRDEILDFVVKEEASGLVNQILSLSDNDRAALLAALGGTSVPAAAPVVPKPS